MHAGLAQYIGAGGHAQEHAGKPAGRHAGLQVTIEQCTCLGWAHQSLSSVVLPSRSLRHPSACAAELPSQTDSIKPLRYLAWSRLLLSWSAVLPSCNLVKTACMRNTDDIRTLS